MSSRFLPFVLSTKSPRCDEHANSERLGAEWNAPRTIWPLARRGCRSFSRLSGRATAFSTFLLSERGHPRHTCEARVHLVLPDTCSGKRPNAMNTQIQRGSVQSGTPLPPSGHLQREAAAHFQGSLVVPQHFRCSRGCKHTDAASHHCRRPSALSTSIHVAPFRLLMHRP